MGTSQKVIRMGHAGPQARATPAEIDGMLSDLARLYLERFKAMRFGDNAAVQALTDQIAAIKTILGQI